MISAQIDRYYIHLDSNNGAEKGGGKVPSAPQGPHIRYLNACFQVFTFLIVKRRKMPFTTPFMYVGLDL